MTETSLHKTAITICGTLRKDAINEHLRRHMSLARFNKLPRFPAAERCNRFR